MQGVGFRASAQQVAQRLGLAGWVRNLADGGVELEAEGPTGDLEQLLACLRKGPPWRAWTASRSTGRRGADG